jgi:hypothetical protein
MRVLKQILMLIFLFHATICILLSRGIWQTMPTQNQIPKVFGTKEPAFYSCVSGE